MCEVLGGTCEWDEDFGKSAPYFYYPLAMKKIFILIFLCAISFNAIHAEFSWNLSDDGTLTLSGTSIPNYSSEGSPWYFQRKEIKKIVIEQGILYIGVYAFHNCSALTSISIPNSVAGIESNAFNGCSALTSVTIPNSVKYIGNYAFAYCSALSSITIPNSVTSIGNSAFANCYSLTSLKIPSSLNSIGNEAFTYCYSLTSITTEKGNAKYDSRNNCNAIIETNSNTLIVGCKNTIIPNSVTRIGNDSFMGNEDLTSITIPNSVTRIGSRAFCGCTNLKSIKISNSVTNIGERAFSACSNITSITIPESVTSIGDYAFFYCLGLTSIICEANTPPDCSIYTFDYVNKSIPVYVPANSIEAYKKADVWKDFTNIQAITKCILTDGTPYNNNSQLNGCKISYTRTFNNTSWQALYIPFSLSYDDWKDDFDVAYINGIRQLDKDDNGTIDETIMDIIKIKSGSTVPNTPYLIKAKKTGEKTLSVSNATLYAAEEKSIDCRTTIVEYTFTGTYNTIPSATMIANNYYAMGGGELIQSDGSNDLKPYRWYMKAESRNSSYNANNAAKTITINVIDDEEEETTGVRELFASSPASQFQITNEELPVYD